MTGPTRLVRAPLGAPVDDETATRTWAVRLMEESIRLHGEVTHAIHLLLDTEQQILLLGPALAAQPDADVGATFAALGGLEAVRRRLLLGEVVQPEVGRAAFVLEVDGSDPPRWWCALRAYEPIAPGVAGFRGPVTETEGTGALPAMLGALVASAGGRVLSLAPPERPEFEVNVSAGRVSDGVPLAEDAATAARLVAHVAADVVRREGLFGALVIRLCGRSFEVWRLQGTLPGAADETIRYICQYGDEADTVGLVLQARVDEAGGLRGGIQVVAEHDGHRARHVITFEQGEDGTLSRGVELRADLGPVADEDHWLGIDPEGGFELGPVGV